jgi:hypothetical protein
VHDTTLAECVDSFLRFRTRPHDLDADEVASSGEEALSRRVLLIYLRWCACGARLVEACSSASLTYVLSMS